MDETEAEAVLLAVGASLDWENEANGYSSRAFLEDGSFYFIGKVKGGWRVLFFRVRDECDVEEQELLSSLSLAATKLACAYHHATGKWE